MEASDVCAVCNECISDLDHNNTVNHRFYFGKWQYNEYRKALISDRHGVTLKVQPKTLNNFQFIFKNVNGKYIVKVTQEQLNLHDRRITFNCEIRNNRNDAIYLTNVYLAHPYPYFKIIHSNGFSDTDDTVVKLLPRAMYKFRVIFVTDILVSASYKIPMCCDFQTIDNKYSFTTARAFLAIVSDVIQENETKAKCPFTNKSWSDVTKTVPSTKEMRLVEKYPIPPKFIKSINSGLERYDGMSTRDESNLNTLKRRVEQLTRDNYGNFWHVLLWMEERANSLMLMKYNMESVKVKIRDDCTLVLVVPGLAEKRPSVIVSDFIRIRVSGDHTAYKGYVYSVNDDSVEISHMAQEFTDYLQKNPDMELDVSFTLGRLIYERMHIAVDKVEQEGLVSKLFLPPTVNVRSAGLREVHDSELYNIAIGHNAEQKTAVNRIVHSTHQFPYIVFGPPGTGKTITIVEAILQIKRTTKKRILVCAPANSACDMLAKKLMKYCNRNELMRLHSSTRERVTITEELKPYSNIDEDDEFLKVDVRALLKYRIVVTTLSLIGRFPKGYHPDCVFVDEAAQATEPETDIAFSLVQGGKQLVLAGDPKQLGPMVTARASKLGLGVSLLERLMKYEVYSLDKTTKTYDPNFITMLKLNFRSHPQILHIPNKLFYENLLEAKSTAAQRDPIATIGIYPLIGTRNGLNKRGQAVEFCSVSAKEKREGASPSFFNYSEAQVAVKYVDALLKLPMAVGYQVRENQIGIVTPYKRQVHKIKEQLAGSDFGLVEVGTTETFQGREKRIIIISTVRAQHSLLLHDRKYNLGFVKNDQRFNVAVTRAISKLIIIGCPLVLKRDNKWTEFMNLCNEYETYFGNRFEDDEYEFKVEVVHKFRGFKGKDDQYDDSEP